MGFFKTIGNMLSGGGVLPALGGVAQTAINAHVAKENTDKTIAANKAMAEYQYSKDLDMWNKANEYNSPKAQMDRFSAAGLNPNLIYGQGNSGNTATSLPKYQAPTARYNYEPRIDIPQTLSMFQDFKLRQAQIDNVKANTENRNADTVLKGYEATIKEYMKAQKAAELNWKYGSGGRKGYNDVLMEGAKTRLKLAESQLEVSSAMLREKLNAIRLSNQLTGFNITGSKLRNIGLGLANESSVIQNAISTKELDWYTFNKISNAVSRIVGGLSIGGIVGNMLKKPSNITNYRVSSKSGEIY